jgi:predicted ATP-dependent endonuclease of OLD family
MKYKKFTISNFKGIEKVELDLTNNRILTLVGLNESGKTTIMQAINVFYELSKGRALTEDEKNSFRPKGVDFTGKISITSTIEYEQEDIKKLNSYLKSLNLGYQIILPKEEFIYTHNLEYNLHVFVEHSRTATFPAKVNFRNTAGKFESMKLFDHDNGTWNKILQFIKSDLLPEIIYYEDFIFSIPEDITYKQSAVTGSNKDVEKNSIWQLVLDDIIKSVNPSFISFRSMVYEIWNTDNDTAQNRISQIEEILNKKITKSWKALFQKETRKINFKEIKISLKTDGGEFKVSFKVKTDDGKLFSINDRSKGCRWFFSFLIFTEFRKNRTRNILFLLDEPASNLHTSAQQKILDAIKELSTTSVVIYSTHSQHLINPKWLSGAYIVINDKISEDTLVGDMTFNDNSKIIAVKYFNYVGKGKGKTKTSYFQPILDALDYAPSLLEPIPNIVVTEGKFDWYAFNYMNDVILKRSKINFYPGGGKDSLWDIIRLYLSWGTHFLVLLDGDAPGVKAKNMYKKELEPFLDDKIFTLQDILKQPSSLEDLFDQEDIKKIIVTEHSLDLYNSVISDKLKTKELFNRSLNMLSFKHQYLDLSDISKNKFINIFDFLDKNLK